MHTHLCPPLIRQYRTRDMTREYRFVIMIRLILSTTKGTNRVVHTYNYLPLTSRFYLSNSQVNHVSHFVYCEFGLTKPSKLCFVDVQGWLFFYLKVVVSLSVKHYHTNLLCNYWLFWLEIVHSVCRLKTGLPPRNVFKDVGVVSCFIQMLWTYYTVCCSLSANGATTVILFGWMMSMENE